MSDLTGALLASAQILPFLSNYKAPPGTITYGMFFFFFSLYLHWWSIHSSGILGESVWKLIFFFFENLMPELLLLTYYTPVVIGLDIEL